MSLHFLNYVANDAKSTQKWKITSSSLVLQVKQWVNYKQNTRFASFDIKFTRLALRIEQASRCQQAFSKLSLVNLI